MGKRFLQGLCRDRGRGERFHGEKRSNVNIARTWAPDSRSSKCLYHVGWFCPADPIAEHKKYHLGGCQGPAHPESSRFDAGLSPELSQDLKRRRGLCYAQHAQLRTGATDPGPRPGCFGSQELDQRIQVAYVHNLS